MMGRIQRCSTEIQARFIRLCCIYWNSECDMDVLDAEIEMGVDEFGKLLKLRIVETDGENLSIKFLDEQMIGIEDKREQASKAGKRSAEVRKRKAEAQRAFNGRSTESNREEESREEEDKEKSKKIRELTFREQVAKHSYSDKLKSDFCDYWTESKPKGRKLRFELQPTFDISRRLKKWESNNFGKKTDTGVVLTERLKDEDYLN